MEKIAKDNLREALNGLMSVPENDVIGVIFEMRKDASRLENTLQYSLININACKAITTICYFIIKYCLQNKVDVNKYLVDTRNPKLGGEYGYVVFTNLLKKGIPLVVKSLHTRYLKSSSFQSYIDDMTREYLVSFAALNNMRAYLPNFMYCFGNFDCPSGPDKTKFCEGSSRNIPFIVNEYFEGNTLDSELKKSKPKNEVVLDWYLQILIALQLSQYLYQFSHNDLHSNNVMLRTASADLEYSVNFPYGVFTVKIKTGDLIPVIIDYGMSTAKINDITTGVTDFIHINRMNFLVPGYDALFLLSTINTRGYFDDIMKKFPGMPYKSPSHPTDDFGIKIFNSPAAVVSPGIWALMLIKSNKFESLTGKVKFEWRTSDQPAFNVNQEILLKNRYETDLEYVYNATLPNKTPPQPMVETKPPTTSNLTEEMLKESLQVYSRLNFYTDLTRGEIKTLKRNMKAVMSAAHTAKYNDIYQKFILRGLEPVHVLSVIDLIKNYRKSNKVSSMSMSISE